MDPAAYTMCRKKIPPHYLIESMKSTPSFPSLPLLPPNPNLLNELRKLSYCLCNHTAPRTTPQPL